MKVQKEKYANQYYNFKISPDSFLTRFTAYFVCLSEMYAFITVTAPYT